MGKSFIFLSLMIFSVCIYGDSVSRQANPFPKKINKLNEIKERYQNADSDSDKKRYKELFDKYSKSLKEDLKKQTDPIQKEIDALKKKLEPIQKEIKEKEGEITRLKNLTDIKLEDKTKGKSGGADTTAKKKNSESDDPLESAEKSQDSADKGEQKDQQDQKNKDSSKKKKKEKKKKREKRVKMGD